MGEIYNIYCDESCHLENDQIRVMSIGAVWCKKAKSKEIHQRIRDIKIRHGLPPCYEAKWSKISRNHSKLYVDIVDYFFDDDDLHFRGLVIPDKSILKHKLFDQTHDTWYYKMFFLLLKVILDPELKYHIYMDYKDTNGRKKIEKLHEVICNNNYDFSRSIVERIQLVRSHEVENMQITDVLTGALTYLHRGLYTNAGKSEVIERIKKRSGYSLYHNTLYKESKINLLIWMPSEDVAE